MKLYGKTLFLKRLFRLKRGVSLTLLPTTRCNQHCHYCPMFLTNGLYNSSPEYPKYKESTFEEWKTWFEHYNEKEAPIFQVEISGGEPSIYKELPELVNYLIERGKHVVIYTNLFKPETLNKIKPHYRLRFKCVYHETDNLQRFYTAFKSLNSKFDKIINEIEGHGKIFNESKVIHQFSEDEIRAFNALHVSPDRNLFCGCDDLYRRGK